MQTNEECDNYHFNFSAIHLPLNNAKSYLFKNSLIRKYNVPKPIYTSYSTVP
jgi:hypothetical protein